MSFGIRCVKKLVPLDDEPGIIIYEKRWEIYSKSTGETLDDCNGFGYKSQNSAYRGYLAKKSGNRKKKRYVATAIKVFNRHNSSFVNAFMEELKANKNMSAEDVKRLFDVYHIDYPGFSPYEYLTYMRYNA